ncbi:MAG: ABC transporter ATP-binding protein [Candidatus Omnitrophica bacterium]|nr:ABC transporter ATP-binding protein [Candidatus Omnitrophota bacterium]
MTGNAITVENVSFAYKTARVITDCSVTLRQGAFTFLMGPNGAGKTTLIKVMCGLLKAQCGTVTIDGTPLAVLTNRERARRIGVIEQDTSYLYPYTAEEVVLMGRYAHASFGMFESPEDEEKGHEAMRMTDTLKFRDRSVLTLSGGERRRVEIARVLAQEADILLLDEPSSHLDIKQQRELFKLLRILNKEKGITLFIISHHLNFIREYGEQVFFMKDGKVSKIDNVDVLSAEDNLIKMF